MEISGGDTILEEDLSAIAALLSGALLASLHKNCVRLNLRKVRLEKLEVLGPLVEFEPIFFFLNAAGAI